MNSHLPGGASAPPAPATERTTTPAPPSGPAVRESTTRAIETARVPTITDLIVTCSHQDDGPRRATHGQTLQVVATASTTVSFSRALARRLSLNGSYKTGGDERITAEVRTSGAGRKEACLTTSTTPSGWQTATSPKQFTVPVPASTEWFPARAGPERKYVHGRGGDDATRMVTIESFPSQQYDIGLDTGGLELFAQQVNALVEHFLEGKFGPFEPSVSLQGPRGQLRLKWGWKEEAANPRVAYNVTVEASLAPIFGIEFGLEMSLVEIAANGALVSCGIPPPVSQRLAELGSEYLADCTVGLSIGASLSLTGTATAKFFSDGSRGGRATLTPAVEGTVTLEVSARIGPRLANCEVTGNVRTGITVEGALEAATDGVTFAPELKWPGVTVNLNVVLRAGDLVEHSLYEGSWPLIRRSTLWTPEGGPIRLAGGS